MVTDQKTGSFGFSLFFLCFVWVFVLKFAKNRGQIHFHSLLFNMLHGVEFHAELNPCLLAVSEEELELAENLAAKKTMQKFVDEFGCGLNANHPAKLPRDRPNQGFETDYSSQRKKAMTHTNKKYREKFSLDDDPTDVNGDHGNIDQWAVPQGFMLPTDAGLRRQNYDVYYSNNRTPHHLMDGKQRRKRRRCDSNVRLEMSANTRTIDQVTRREEMTNPIQLLKDRWTPKLMALCQKYCSKSMSNINDRFFQKYNTDIEMEKYLNDNFFVKYKVSLDDQTKCLQHPSFHRSQPSFHQQSMSASSGDYMDISSDMNTSTDMNKSKDMDYLDKTLVSKSQRYQVLKLLDSDGSFGRKREHMMKHSFVFQAGSPVQSRHQTNMGHQVIDGYNINTTPGSPQASSPRIASVNCSYQQGSSPLRFNYSDESRDSPSSSGYGSSPGNRSSSINRSASDRSSFERGRDMVYNEFELPFPVNDRHEKEKVHHIQHLCDLVNRCMLHGCSDYCLELKRKRKAWVCRFRYGSVSVEDRKKNRTTYVDASGRACHKEPMIETQSGKSKLEGSRDHPFIVQHFDTMLEGYNANCDCQYSLAPSKDLTPLVGSNQYHEKSKRWWWWVRVVVMLLVCYG